MIRFKTLNLFLSFLLISIVQNAQDFTWADRAGGLGMDYMSDMVTCSDGNVAMVGTYTNTVLDIDTVSLPANFYSSGFIAKLNPEGNALWAKAIIGNGGVVDAKGVGTDSITGDLYIAGIYTQSVTIGGTTLPNYGGFGNGFLVKYSSSGVFQWARSFIGTNAVVVNDVVADGAGNVYCTGFFRENFILNNDTLETPPGLQTSDVFVTKLNASGSTIWTEVFHSYGSISGGNQEARNTSIGLLSNGDVILAGPYKDSLVTATGTVYPLSGNTDLFFTRLNSSGSIQWIETAGGSSNDEVRDLAIDQNDNAFITGLVNSNGTFGSLTLTGSGSATFYLAKLDSSGSFLEVESSSSGISYGHSIDVDHSGGVYLVGKVYSNSSFGSYVVNSSGGSSNNMYVAKYNSVQQGWEWVLTSNNLGANVFEDASSVAVMNVDDLLIGGDFQLSMTLGSSALASQGNTDMYYGRISNCDDLEISASFAAGSGSLCQFQPVPLVSDSDPLYEYQWFGNGVAIPGAIDSVYTAIVPGNYYVVADSSSCSDTSNVLTVAPSNNLNVSLASLNSVCENDSAFVLTGGSPSGGTYTGVGISGGIFDPNISGPGSFQITYSYTDTNGCTDSASKSLQVYAAPSAILSPLDTICSGELPVTLTGGLPAGGTYSGIGVSAGSFDPSVAGIGTHMIYYSVSNANCSATDSSEIVVVNSPNVSINFSSPVCQNASPVLMTATPSGGSFSGTGVSGNYFIPQIVNPGDYAISYTVSQNGCSSTSVDTISVDSFPAAILAPIAAVCESEAPFDLSIYANTSAGYFVGTGVSGTTFDPSAAGPGSHAISFIASNSCGNDTASQTIVVNPLPAVTLTLPADICINESPLAMNGGLPAGGSYAGNGVSGNSFNPFTAGAGTQTITYTFSDINGCEDSTSQNITVNAQPVVSLDTLGGICVNRPPFTLSNGLPAGGTYSGTGVSSGNFNPTTAGIGFHNLSYTFTDANGCADSASINVDVRITFEDTVQHVGCDSFTTELGTTYYTSGVYVDSLLTLGNCDSVIIRQVTIHTSTLDSIEATACYEYTSPTNQIYSNSGIYFDTLSTVHGCDSVIRTDLTINDTTFGSISPIACNLYTSPGGQTFTASGVYYDTLLNHLGCDSLLTINLTINSSDFDTLITEACDAYISPGGQILSSSGIYSDTLTNAFGCDSVLLIDLSIFNSSSDTVLTTACDTYTSAGGGTYTSSGLYVENYSNINGCDSNVVENVVILPSSAASLSATACDSYDSPGGNTYTSSGTYTDTLTNALGCDSIITINLMVHPEFIDTVTATACDSFMIAASGQWVFASGFYNDTLSTINGCDSVITSEVTINPSVSTMLPVTACDSFTSPMGSTYFSSTVFSDTFMTNNGCDSIVSYDLTINPSEVTLIPITSCDSFVSPSGTVYNASGMFDEVLSTVHGCDSVVTYDVTIHPSVSTAVPVISCDSFTSPSGMAYFSTGVFDEVLATSEGCDSTVTYDITINNSIAQTIATAACDSFTSPAGVVYHATGMYQETLTTTQGCDSIVTYDLTIHPSFTTTISDSACGVYITPLGEVYTTTGIYTDTTTSTAGCDSVLIYDLTIGQPDTSSISITSCGSYTSDWGAVYNTSGIYVDSSFVTSLGCDSVTFLDLTIVEVDTSVSRSLDTLIANAGASGADLQWLKCEDTYSPIQGETSASFIPTQSGEYAVEVTFEGCTDTSSCYYAEAVGVYDLSSEFPVRIYPNPTRGEINIDFGAVANEAELELRNSFGQLVLRKRVLETDFTTLHLNEAAGVYFLNITSNGSSGEFKVVVQ